MRPKPVQRTHASSSSYTDKLVQLRSELQVGLGLAKTVLEQEGLKRDRVSVTRDVWLVQCKLVDAWKSKKQGKGPGMGVDEALSFDKERVVKKPGYTFDVSTLDLVTDSVQSHHPQTQPAAHRGPVGVGDTHW